jgi:CelD/BcsL family acetyltransferase involved in cellulose biosynthesis
MTLASTLEPDATAPADAPADISAGTILTLRPDDPRYRAFAQRHVFASLFTSPPWLGALETAYGFELEVAALCRRGEIVAAIPYCRIDDLRGPRLVAPPFSDYGDPLVEDASDLRTLLDHLAGHGIGLRLRSLRNPLPAEAVGIGQSGEAFWHGIDLERPLDAIWAGLDGSARQNSRKAERSGVTVRIGHDLGDLELFHRMHVQLRKTKYRMLAQPFGLFAAIRDGFGATPESADNVAVVIAEAAGEQIAGILLILWQGTAYYKFNASFDTRLRPNDLLTWHAIRYAKDRACGLFDFGISDTDQPGLVRYKRKFATEEKVMRQLVLPSPRPPAPHEVAAGRTLGRLTELLTRPGVPDAVTSEAGDALYRYFA